MGLFSKNWSGKVVVKSATMKRPKLTGNGLTIPTLVNNNDCCPNESVLMKNAELTKNTNKTGGFTSCDCTT